MELAATEARTWTGGLIVGYSFVPQAYMGFMGQARVARLITGQRRSLTRPDLYVFVGGSVNSVWGAATLPFQEDLVNADQVLAASKREGPRTSFGGFQVGLDGRIGRRIGVSTYLETLPGLVYTPNMGTYVQFIFAFQSIGTEVTFWF